MAEAKLGEEEAFEKEMLAVPPSSREERGCVAYEVYRSMEHPRTYLFYEVWNSRESLDKHMEMDYVKRFFRNTEGLLASPLRVHYYSTARL